MTGVNEDRFPVVVVGAGLAGLTAGIYLADGGVPPLVLEADSLWAGGRLSGGEPDTFEHGGRTWSFTTEHGMHALWGNYDNMRAMFDRFLDVELQPSPGEEWVNRWGREVRYIEAGNAVRSRWIPAPFHYFQLLFNPNIWSNITPLDFLSLPGILASLLLTVGLDPIKEQTPLDGLRLNEYFRGWTPNFRATLTGIGVNLLAAHEDDISLSAMIAAMRFYTMLRRDAWQLQYMTKDANRALIQPLIEQIEAKEGMVMTGTEVTGLQREGDNWRVIVEDSRRGGRRSLLAERVILAVEPPAAKRILSAYPDTSDEAYKLFFPDTVRSVAARLWFDASPRDGTPGGMMTGDFVPDNFFWLHRLYDGDFHAWHEQTGGSIIELHFYPTNKQAEKDDTAFLVMALDEVQRAFPRVKGHFVHGAVRRNLKTQPIFRVPTRNSLFVDTPWDNILACGDWVGYEDNPSMWMERSVITGQAAANRVLSANGRTPYAIIPPREPERSVKVLSGVIHMMRRILGPPIVGLYRRVRRRA